MTHDIPPTTSPTPANVAQVPRLALTRTEAAEAIGVSARMIDSLLADRNAAFPAVRLGARVAIPVRELQNWLAEKAKEGRT